MLCRAPPAAGREGGGGDQRLEDGGDRLHDAIDIAGIQGGHADPAGADGVDRKLFT